VDSEVDYDDCDRVSEVEDKVVPNEGVQVETVEAAEAGGLNEVGTCDFGCDHEQMDRLVYRSY
jgi:hypothetical protein